MQKKKTTSTTNNIFSNFIKTLDKRRKLHFLDIQNVYSYYCKHNSDI
jgi:hypothetical protein